MDNYRTRSGFDARQKNVEKAVANVAAFSTFYTLFDTIWIGFVFTDDIMQET